MATDAGSSACIYEEFNVVELQQHCHSTRPPSSWRTGSPRRYDSPYAGSQDLEEEATGQMEQCWMLLVALYYGLANKIGEL
jgi:hypothetical protein